MPNFIALHRIFVKRCEHTKHAMRIG